MSEIEIFLSFVVLLLLVSVLFLNGRCNELEEKIEELKWNSSKGIK